MLKIKQFAFNDFQENTYLIFNEKKQCWFIDPGMYYEREINQIISFIDDNNLIPQNIINTHTHIDHIFGVITLLNKYNIKFGIHKEELPVLNYAETSAAVMGIDFNLIPKPDFFIEEAKPLMLGDDTLEVFHCPGHSPGSITFYYPQGNWVIVGDVLFAGSIGRSDLPGGSFETLIDSIKNKLFKLPAQTVVYPGHGPSTTINNEKLHNPFCKITI